MIASEKLWLNAERTQLVKDGDEKAAFLFCIKGQNITDAQAKKFGLLPAEKVPAANKIEARETRITGKLREK